MLRRSAPACDELSITRPGGELYATQFFSARTVKFVLFLPGAGQPYRAAQSRQSAQAAWCALASTFRGRALFSYMSGAAVPDVLEYFGLDAKRDFPVLVAHDPARDRKYLSARPLALEPEELRAFVSGVLEGTLRHALKSEPLPKQAARKSGGSYVVRAVGDTVLEIVGREGRDVLLEVYAAWCAHCRRLAPAVEILARAVAAEDRIVVAKIDGTLNDLPPSWGVKTYPALLWFPAVDKPYSAGVDPVPRPYWDAGQSLPELATFVQRHSSFPAASLRVATTEQLGSLMAEEEALRARFAAEELVQRRNEGRAPLEPAWLDWLAGEVVFDGTRAHLALAAGLALATFSLALYLALSFSASSKRLKKESFVV